MCWDDTIVDLQHEEFAFDLGLNKISAGWTKGQATKQKKQAQNQETTGLQIQNLSQILFKLKIKFTPAYSDFIYTNALQHVKQMDHLQQLMTSL